MKRIIVTILIATSLLTLAACTEDQKNKAAVEAIETAEVSSNVAAAQKYLTEVKKRMAEEVKPEYFDSEEWRAFVDAYWQGYNEGQKQMLHPEYITESDITY